MSADILETLPSIIRYPGYVHHFILKSHEIFTITQDTVKKNLKITNASIRPILNNPIQ